MTFRTARLGSKPYSIPTPVRPFTEANAGENVMVGATTTDVLTAGDVVVTAEVLVVVITVAVDEFAEPELGVEHPEHAVRISVTTAA